MPRAIPLVTRHEIVHRRLDGQTLGQIALDLHLPHVTVRALWRAFRRRGDAGLVIGYSACGRSTPGHSGLVLRRGCQLKRRHPNWGAGRVRVELLGLLEAGLVPSTRTLQRAFQREGINQPRRSQRPRAVRAKPEAPHDVWEVDAVEKTRLKTGAEVSWMAAVDVYSGALLTAELSPPAPMANDPPERRAGLVSSCFPTLGPAAVDPRRQRTPLGTEPGTSAGFGPLADRPGGVHRVDSAGPAPTERPCRARQWRDPTVGRAGVVFDTGSIAGAIN